MCTGVPKLQDRSFAYNKECLIILSFQIFNFTRHFHTEVSTYSTMYEKVDINL